MGALRERERGGPVMYLFSKAMNDERREAAVARENGEHENRHMYAYD